MTERLTKVIMTAMKNISEHFNASREIYRGRKEIKAVVSVLSLVISGWSKKDFCANCESNVN